MNKILWNHSECAYCGRNIEEPEEMEASVLMMIPGACPSCGTRNCDDDRTFRICAKCYFFIFGSEMEDEDDESLIQMGLLKIGETKAEKIKELEEAFKKRTGK